MRTYRAFLLLFLLLSVFFYLLHRSRPAYDAGALIAGNGIMAALSAFTCHLVLRQLGKRPQAFVRSVYAATFLKLMVCMTALLAYVLVNRAHLHKPSLFLLMGIYAVYTAVETMLLSRQARQIK